MVLKWIGAMMVIVSSGALGFTCSGRLRKRLSQLRAVRQILYMLKGEISYSASTLPEAFSHIARKTPPPFREFLERVSGRLKALEGENLELVWQQEIQRIRKRTSLTGADIEEWEDLGGRLGYLDRTMQLQLIDLFLSQWEEKIRLLEKECGKTCRLYQYLGVLAGLMLAVVLL